MFRDILTWRDLLSAGHLHRTVGHSACSSYMPDSVLDLVEAGRVMVRWGGRRHVQIAHLCLMWCLLREKNSCTFDDLDFGIQMVKMSFCIPDLVWWICLWIHFCFCWLIRQAQSTSWAHLILIEVHHHFVKVLPLCMFDVKIYVYLKLFFLLVNWGRRYWEKITYTSKQSTKHLECNFNNLKTSLNVE